MVIRPLEDGVFNAAMSHCYDRVSTHRIDVSHMADYEEVSGVSFTREHDDRSEMSM